MSDPTPVTISDPVDLIAVIPHLLGYEPGDGDVVLIGLRDAVMVMTARTNSADVATGREHELVDALAGPVSHTPLDAAVIVGYGDSDHVDAAIDALYDFLSARGILVVDAFRVFGGRYYPHIPAAWKAAWKAAWNGVLPEPGDGVPFDAEAAAVTATMIVSGSVAQPNRAALADQFRPVTGTDRADMHAATVRARHRLQHMTAGSDDPAAVIAQAGRRAAAVVYQRHNAGDRPSDDEAAWLTLLLTHTAVRDHMWLQTHGHHGHLALWTDLTRRAEPDLVAAPATLLAFTAWQMGDGIVAAIALQRALDADPGYGLATLLQVALAEGIPPTGFGQRFRFAADPLDTDGEAAG